jgi:hypothetical protein
MIPADLSWPLPRGTARAVWRGFARRTKPVPPARTYSGRVFAARCGACRYATDARLRAAPDHGQRSDLCRHSFRQRGADRLASLSALASLSSSFCRSWTSLSNSGFWDIAFHLLCLEFEPTWKKRKGLAAARPFAGDLVRELPLASVLPILNNGLSRSHRDMAVPQALDARADAHEGRRRHGGKANSSRVTAQPHACRVALPA